MKGTVVVGGVSFGIVTVELTGGQLHLVAQRHGPVAASGPSPVTVFGADGLGCFQGGSAALICAAEGQIAQVSVDLKIVACE